MAHSVELLFDAGTESTIVGQWQVLSDAGLPSLAHHRSSTNRPHVTLVAAAAIDGAADGALRPLAATLPVSCRIGAPMVFGAGRFTLVRSIVATAELLGLHAEVHDACVTHLPHGAYDHTEPGRWTAHVTLARRMSAEQIAAALALLEPGEPAASFTAMRRWDGDARVDTALA